MSEIQDNLETTKCPNCLCDGMELFHSMENVPVHSVMNIYTKQDALDFPTGKIELKFCPSCGFISNRAFEQKLMGYSEDCQEAQDYSSTFRNWLEGTTQKFIDKYDVHGKKIIEIGCGKGEFLNQICRMGGNSGIGVDPAYTDNGESENVNTEFIADYYSEKYANLKGDVICCRMTLEHIPNPHEFMNIVKRSLEGAKDTLIYFQVPNADIILKNCLFEDIYYEHCSYFSAHSLQHLFEKCGFEVLNVRSEYDQQYLVIEAKHTSREVTATPWADESKIQAAQLVKGFQRAYDKTMSPWKQLMKDQVTNPKKIVVWGSGSKGVSFLTRLKIFSEIEYVVDINPHRQKTYMAGTGQLVVAPSFLKEYKPDLVVIMNPIYKNEIAKDLNSLGLNPEIKTLGMNDG